MSEKMSRKLFQEKLKKMWDTNNVSVPMGKKPLFEWLTPQILTTGSLNWSKWLNGAKEQEKELIDFIENGHSFMLWKKTEPKQSEANGVSIISKKDAIDLYLFDLMLQEYSPILYDNETEEVKQKLLYREEDARKKIEEAEVCYSIGHDSSDPKGIAIVSTFEKLQYSFVKRNDALSSLGIGVGEQHCKGIVYLDVIFTKREKGMKYGSKLIQKIENDYPNHILCTFSVPKRSTLYFYYTRGFNYSSMKKSAPNLLGRLLNKIDVAIEAWNGGFPLMTRLHADDEIRRVRISLISNTIDWKTRSNVNIFFDNESLNFLAPSYPNTREDVTDYILRNRTAQRIIIVSPLFRMTKKEYHDVTEKLLQAGNDILKHDESIQEVVVVCDNNEDRQLLLKQIASKVWGNNESDDTIDLDIQLPTPEKNYKINAPKTPTHSDSSYNIKSPPRKIYKK